MLLVPRPPGAFGRFGVAQIAASQVLRFDYTHAKLQVQQQQQQRMS